MVHSEKHFTKFRSKADNLTYNKVSLKYVQEMNEKLRKQIGDEKGFEMLKFFSDEFANIEEIDHKGYMLSNYYKDRVFDNNPNFKLNGDGEVDGIFYPSVVSGYDDDNIVLTPTAADDKLKFIGAMNVWCTYNHKTGDMSFNPLTNSQGVEGDQIKWNKTFTFKDD